MKYIVSVEDCGYLVGAALHENGVNLTFTKKLENARHFKAEWIEDIIMDVEALGYGSVVKKEVGQ